jgi:hypothetical protein
MNDVCAPIKNISADGAVSFPSSIPILPNCHSLAGHWGAGILPAEVTR